MQTFLDVRPIVLDEVVTLDGPGDNCLDSCNFCGNETAPLYRCLECSYDLLHCSECICKLHRVLPLHRLEVRSCSSLYAPMLIASSAGRTAFSTGPLSTHSDTSVTLDTRVIRAPQTPPTVNSPSSTSTVGIECGLYFANVVRAVSPMSTIVNSSACAGTLRPLIARKRRLHSTFSRRTTR